MKSLSTHFIVIFLTLISCNLISAQDTLGGKIVSLLDLSQASATLPSTITNAGENRGASFNGRHIFIASRTGGNNVSYLDVTNPLAGPKNLNMAGVSGGTFVVSDVVTQGNHIIMSNMAFKDGLFKVYYWNNLDSASTLLLQVDKAPQRLGDALSLIGDPGKNAQLIVSGHGSKSMFIWDIESGKIKNTTPKEITFADFAHVNFARITPIPNENLYLASGPDFRFALLNDKFEVVDKAGGEFALSWPMYARVFIHEGKRYLSYVHVRTTPAENEHHILDITDGKDMKEAFANMKKKTVPSVLVFKSNLGTVSNGNASVGHSILKDDAGNVTFFSYAAGNGLKLSRLGNKVLARVVPLKPITTVLDFTKASNKLPAAIDNAGNNRGASFNGEHVFIASRQGGNNVFFYDPKNPAAEPGKLNMTGVAGGTFTVSDVATSGKHIIMSNMAFKDGNFKVYHWPDTKAEPKVLLNIPVAPARLGDAITVIGDPGTKAQLFVSGHATKNFYQWDINAGKIDSINPKVIVMDSLPNVSFARINKVPDEDMYLLSGSDARLALLDKNFKQIDRAAGEYVLSWPMHAQVFYNQGRRYMSYIHVKTTPSENELHVIDITKGSNITEAFKSMRDSSITKLFAHTANLGNVSNGNASVGHSIAVDAEGKTWLMGYAAGNGFILQRVADMFTNTEAIARLTEFEMYPNPAHEEVRIKSEYGIKNIILFDLNGQVIQKNEVNDHWVTLNISALKQGTYIVMLNTAQGTVARKLMVQK